MMMKMVIVLVSTYSKQNAKQDPKGIVAYETSVTNQPLGFFLELLLKSIAKQ
jgi:hypothetical protein